MNILIIWKKNTCFNQVVYEWNIEKNQTAVRLQIIRNFMIKILENTKKLFVFVQ